MGLPVAVGHGLRAVSAAIALVLMSASAAHATAIERNLPPPTNAAPSQIAPPAAPSVSNDDTPLGPSLRGIILLGPTEPQRNVPISGIDTSGLPRMDTQDAHDILEPYLNRKITRRLIGEIAATIVRHYRDLGYPFVSVTTPPQEITSGVIQFRVIEFRRGAITVAGNRSTPSRYLVDAIRVKRGRPINADLLGQDLDDLNRYPFRNVQVAVTPSKQFGETDIELNVTENAPWSVSLSFANSGTDTTGMNRYSIGVQLGSLIGQDSLLSYQFTTGSDFWIHRWTLFGAAGHPQYLSHAASLDLPIAPREAIEFSLDAVEEHVCAPSPPIEINGFCQDFDDGTQIYEATVGTRTAVSNFVPLPGYLRFGLEAKREAFARFFGSTNITRAPLEVYQAYVDWNDGWSDGWGRSSLDLSLRAAPGGFDAADSAKGYAAFGTAQGAVSFARPQHLFFNGSFSRSIALPFDLTFLTRITGQYAGTALPDTEQIALGGVSAVRGFILDDGSFDTAFVARNELHAPTFSLFGDGVWGNLVAPYAFVDAGTGNNRLAHRTTTLASTGAGLDYALGPHLSLDFDGAYALDNAAVTRSGDWRVDAHVGVAL